MHTKNLLIAAAGLLAVTAAAAHADSVAPVPTTCAAINAEMSQLATSVSAAADQQKKAARKRGLMGFAKALASNVPMANFGGSTAGAMTTIAGQTAVAAMTQDGSTPAPGMDGQMAATQARMALLATAASQQNCVS